MSMVAHDKLWRHMYENLSRSGLDGSPCAFLDTCHLVSILTIILHFCTDCAS